MPEKSITQTIEALIRTMSFPIDDIVMEEDTNGAILFYTIKTSNPRVLIGRDGETLAALNHLARKLTDKHMENIDPRPEIIIDVDGFQKKKIDAIKAVAHMMAERARFFKSNIEVEPMGAFERKIVHSFLSSAKDLKTESTGEGHNRRVVIKYVIDEGV